MLSILTVAAVVSIQPHVLMLVVDDLGWADVGYNGGDMPSPSIDKLAEEGIKLGRYYMQPVCSPTRSAFMTGRYPFTTGLQHMDTIVPGSTAGIPQDVPTLPEHLRKAGYSTYMIGKWHIGYSKWEQTPTERGFDHYTGYMQGMGDYYGHNMSIANLNGYDFWNGKTPDAPVGVYSVDAFMQTADKYLADISKSGTPSFMYFAHQNMHVPLQYPPVNSTECENKSPEGRRAYCNMMYAVDTAIGRLVDMYKQNNLWDDTLMILTTDNGAMVDFAMAQKTGRLYSSGSNWPLRAGKTTLFDGGVRAIGFVQGGVNVIPSSVRGTTFTGLIHAADWLPTILDSAGVVPLPAVDGVSQWSALVKGGNESRTEVPINIYGAGTEFTAHILGEWKLIVKPNISQTDYYDGYWTVSPYTYLPPPSMAEEYLFNLIDDPTEQHNVVVQHPDKVAQIKERIAFYVNRSYVEPQPNMYHPAGNPDNNGGYWAPFRE
eukprot:TRINITY_DN1900_c4_g1_i1.p1 TRINITY_DN1900_c4_g1~~TRINITY_DN1900_c4_g1_i1.p1  ORF type:complete len:487 (+),score=130.85 TRINITY_DN1900_c4_g1_i1:62-1522(+)